MKRFLFRANYSRVDMLIFAGAISYAAGGGNFPLAAGGMVVGVVMSTYYQNQLR